uniref:Uncharacterized protein n=1 Tax=Rhizophora mucronata TaxID=61149 RepID=A0A2P2NUB1_RHIMU
MQAHIISLTHVTYKFSVRLLSLSHRQQNMRCNFPLYNHYFS